jgi:hypothetical protein
VNVVGRDEGWLEIALEGWVWMPSLQVTDRGGYDVVVSAAEGENLRAQPSGEILGRVSRGTLLEELERIPGWVRVRRVAWMWAPSLSTGGTTAARPLASVPTGARGSATASSVTPAPASTAPPASATGRPVPGFRSAGSAGAAILASPDGDTLARTIPGTGLQVVGREGGWARVRIEGWTWLPEDGTSSGEPIAAPSPADLAAEPDRFRGRIVSWELQFLSLERAERIRTDFFEGEPFLLARHASGGYVYVALAPERLAEALTLTPLERITVVGRVRAPVSALTGSPIIDLIDLGRVRR